MIHDLPSDNPTLLNLLLQGVEVYFMAEKLALWGVPATGIILALEKAGDNQWRALDQFILDRKGLSQAIDEMKRVATAHQRAERQKELA